MHRLLNIFSKLLTKAIDSGGGGGSVSGNSSGIGGQINTILHDWVGPIMIALGGCAFIYSIVLGVQYARSENDGKRAEVKTRLVNCLIGFVAILVLGVLALTVDWVGLASIFGYAASGYNSIIKPIL